MLTYTFCSGHGQVIALFEAEDLTSVLVFVAGLDNCRLTHSLLGELLDLDPFDDMWTEKNASMNPASNYGRIEHKIIYELLWDIVPHFVYQSNVNGERTANIFESGMHFYFF